MGAVDLKADAAVVHERSAATPVPPETPDGPRADDASIEAPVARPSHGHHSAASHHDRSRWTAGPDPVRAP
jgi:hypothetical protein